MPWYHNSSNIRFIHYPFCKNKNSRSFEIDSEIRFYIFVIRVRFSSYCSHFVPKIKRIVGGRGTLVKNQKCFKILFRNMKYARNPSTELQAFELELGGKKKIGIPFRVSRFWCERRDLNPYAIDTRPSNVPVCQFQHSRDCKQDYIKKGIVCQYLISKKSNFFKGIFSSLD